jgi:hypothetical protein
MNTTRKEDAMQMNTPRCNDHRDRKDLPRLVPDGNNGWDVISDYTVNLEKVLKPINEYADSLS